MNQNKKLDKGLPDTTCKFSVSVTGTVTKKDWSGDFECHVPTMNEQAQIEKHEAFLNGPMTDYLDSTIKNLHEMIAYLRFTLTDFPGWWKDADLGYALRDYNVVKEVYKNVVDFENNWAKQIWGDDTDEKEESSGGT